MTDLPSSELFDTLLDFMAKMKATNGTNAKKSILQEYPHLKDILECIYNPYKKNYITSTNIKKFMSPAKKASKKSVKQAPKRQKTTNDSAQDTFFNTVTHSYDIFKLLQTLQRKSLTGHAALYACSDFITKYDSKYNDLIFAILDKDLKVGVQPTVINSIFPNLIPIFDVVLANDYSDVVAKVDFQKDKWFCSRKLDGCRCIVMVDDDGLVNFFSRAGNEFEQLLDNAVKEVQALVPPGHVLDCEVCILGEDGNEDFKAVVSEIHKKNHTIAKPRLYVFDVITLEQFKAGKSESCFEERQAKLTKLFSNYSGQVLTQLPQDIVTSAEALAASLDDATSRGWEGLILRKNVPYEAKRSNDTLKVKKFLDAEFTVLGTVFGKKQILKNGIKTEVDVLSSVEIEFERNKVNVGSGFSDEERERLFAQPLLILGKQITVQYFEATENKKGGKSMRFPTVKQIWWQPRNI